MNDLARDTEPIAIRRAGRIDNSFANYAPISRHTGEPVDLPPTPDWLATISAGKRGPSRDGRPGLPEMNRDGRIELHDPDGRAPGLAAALAATDHKSLLIAFVSNDLRDVIQEHIVGYSATALRFHGNSESITELTPHGRVVHHKGTPGYAAALAQCTVSRRVFFALAGWDEDGTPRVRFVDGLGVYSIRTTSARSTANIAATLAMIGRQTGGVIVGLPFDLSLSARQVADPAGNLRTVRLWSMVFSPPKTMQLTSGTFRALAEKSLEQGRALVLPASPRPESIEDAAYEGSFTVDEAPAVCNPTAQDVAIMERGTPADEAAARRRWFATVKGTRFDTESGRADFISAWTDGNDASLAEFIDAFTQEEVDAMLATLQRCIQDGQRLPTAWEGLEVDDEPADPAPVEVIDRETGELTALEPPERRRDLLLRRYDELWAEAFDLALEIPARDAAAGWSLEQITEAGLELRALIASARAEHDGF